MKKVQKNAEHAKRYETQDLPSVFRYFRVFRVLPVVLKERGPIQK